MNLITYYTNLEINNAINNKRERQERIKSSERTMCRTYRALTKLEDKKVLYNTMINNSNRQIITRWRLSSHPLFIETGRCKVPIIPKEDRVCIICSVIEDENHALFNCVAHSFLRVKHKEIYDKYPNTAAMLNPKAEERRTWIL